MTTRKMDEMNWFYAKYGKQDGPVDLETLRAKLQSGELAPTDLVWKEGMPEWTAAETVADLTSASTAPTPARGDGPALRYHNVRHTRSARCRLAASSP